MGLSINELSAGYGKNIIIKNASLQVADGSIVTLIGPNGAGKSTLIKTVSGIIPKLSGDIYIDDENTENMTLSNKAKKMSVMLTEKSSSEYATTFDVVAVGRYRYTGILGQLEKNDIDIINNTLNLVGAYELKDKVFSCISDGQRQRVLLARALVSEPKILILDEPTGYLDIGGKLEFLALLKRLVSEKNTAVLMSMHEIELASKVSDKIVAINGNNEIEKQGSPNEVLTSEYVSKLFNVKAEIYKEYYNGI